MDNLDYGIIGNCKSAALISKTGTIDWCSLPDFDASTIFAGLLDEEKGGHFAIKVDDSYTITQDYVWNTNILKTTFKSLEGSFELLDFMPRYEVETDGYHTPPDVVRYFKYLSGAPKFRLDYEPRLEYARYATIIEERKDCIKSYTEEGNYDSIYLYTNLSKKDILAKAEIVLKADAFVMISYHQKILEQTIEHQYLKLNKTKVYWLDWAYVMPAYTHYKKEISRSALTLKMLSYDKTGAGSKPVRVGNAAYVQKQNDIYGVLMNVIHQHFELIDTSLEISEYLWTITRGIVKTVGHNWQEPDKGIWEIRGEEKHFVFSKVLCWVAIDRAVSIAKIVRKNDYVEEWSELAATIKKDIYANGWNEKVQSFTQYYGSDDQDAANLLMESYGFIDASDEKYRLTVKAIEKELCEDGLMYRYRNHDDFGVPSSSFTICTFWMINSLQAIGEVDKAKAMFDQLLSYSNHLGLFSEDIDFKTKRLLGNFPQAYSHLALIETAINISHGSVSRDAKILRAIHGE
jgi:GH15 family glucan-1,4-alpha-glucosidase